MIFFPLLYNVPGMIGHTTLHNFPPNNWEKFLVKSKSINVSWSDGERWCTKKIGSLEPYESKKISYHDIKNLLPLDTLPLLSLTDKAPNTATNSLSFENNLITTWPMWRATLGLENNDSFTSYQGELIPFPSSGSMLSLAPFFQNDAEISYLILVNIEIKPEFRAGIIEIFSSKSKEKILSKKIKTNNISIIDISGVSIDHDDMLVFISTDFSSIPLIFSSSTNHTNLSLEHTHPPASLSILGNRFMVQKDIKKKWFQLLS
jgi:hypothetical protein